MPADVTQASWNAMTPRSPTAARQNSASRSAARFVCSPSMKHRSGRCGSEPGSMSSVLSSIVVILPTSAPGSAPSRASMRSVLLSAYSHR